MSGQPTEEFALLRTQEAALYYTLLRTQEAVLRAEAEMLETLLDMRDDVEVEHPDHVAEMRALSRKFYLPLPYHWRDCV